MQQQFVEFWNNLDKSQKTRIYITSGILVVAITIGIFLMARPNYTAVVSNADSKEIAEMQQILTDKKIDYRLTEDKKGLMVNVRDSDKAHFELGVAGFPKGGMTFADAYKYIKINTTESDKKKIWKEYEVASLISQLKMFESVSDARVLLTTPERSIFSEVDIKPTAAVSIIPKGELTPQQVEGIVMVVARSVEGMDPKDVTVTDDMGNILNGDMALDEVTGKTNNQYDMKLKVKALLEKNVKDIFNGQFDSFDVIRPIANPVLDFNTLRSHTEGVANPTGMDDGAVISSEKTKENLENGAIGGVPGQDSNPGGSVAPSYQTGTNQNSSYNKTTEKVNRKYTETLTEEEKALGEMISEKSSFAATLLYGKRVADDSKLTLEFIDQVKDTISKATGIPVTNITVNKLHVAPVEVEAKPVAEVVKELINDYGLFAIMLLLIGGLMIAAIPRKKREMHPELAGAGDLSAPRFVVPESLGDLPEIELEERSEIKKQIDKFVKQKPDAVAQLLRNWLSDEWD
jgi:flagellar M-ring protein FliF